MADELDSGSSARKGVWVQVPSSAYDKKKVSGFCLRLFFLQSEDPKEHALITLTPEDIDKDF